MPWMRNTHRRNVVLRVRGGNEVSVSAMLSSAGEHNANRVAG
jgi:hypothetical protein